MENSSGPQSGSEQSFSEQSSQETHEEMESQQVETSHQKETEEVVSETPEVSAPVKSAEITHSLESKTSSGPTPSQITSKKELKIKKITPEEIQEEVRKSEKHPLPKLSEKEETTIEELCQQAENLINEEKYKPGQEKANNAMERKNKDKEKLLKVA